MKEQVRIRAFTPEDYGEIIALPSDTLPEIAKLLALPSNAFLVAEAGAREMPPAIVGTVIGVWDGRRGWIYHLAVKPAARRGRIGSALMNAAEEALRRCGATKINLLIEPGNNQAAEFYRALGYSSQPLQFFSKNLGA